MRKKRLDPYPRAVLVTVRRRRLLAPADVVLAAVSAGPDSTALVAALAVLRDAGAIARVVALHVDHRLRPGGAEDAACAAAACARLGVPFESVPVHVAAGNVQTQARRSRYAALRSAAARAGANRIATGHTRTDQAETVLLRLVRGAGARGLAGIPPRRGPFVRPLIDRSRKEGIAWLAELGLPWRDDPTNATPRAPPTSPATTSAPSPREAGPSRQAAVPRCCSTRSPASRSRCVAAPCAGSGAGRAGGRPTSRRPMSTRCWRSR